MIYKPRRNYRRIMSQYKKGYATQTHHQHPQKLKTSYKIMTETRMSMLAVPIQYAVPDVQARAVKGNIASPEETRIEKELSKTSLLSDNIVLNLEETLYAIAGNVHCSSHCGEQYGGSLKDPNLKCHVDQLHLSWE